MPAPRRSRWTILSSQQGSGICYNALTNPRRFTGWHLQNVTTRQNNGRSQVSELTRNKLKSTLDLSFADVSLSQAKLLLLDAQNNVQAFMAALDAVLGLNHEVDYDLVDDAPKCAGTAGEMWINFVQLGLKQRPDLQALDLNQQAAVKYSHAQRDQMLPSIAAAGTVGSVPIRPPQGYVTNWWGAIGVSMNIPVFNGFLYSAEAKEATIRAQAAARSEAVICEIRSFAIFAPHGSLPILRTNARRSQRNCCSRRICRFNLPRRVIKWGSAQLLS